MNAKLLFKIRQTGRNYKNKSKITYLLIAANFFLLFSLYYCIFCCCLSIDPSVGRHLCFERDKKRYRGTKNDITGQKTISRDISFLCHRVIALIKAQVCDKQLYQHEWKLEKREIVWKHDALRAECFHTISSFSNFHEC